jgi:hypothetical protein
MRLQTRWGGWAIACSLAALGGCELVAGLGDPRIVKVSSAATGTAGTGGAVSGTAGTGGGTAMATTGTGGATCDVSAMCGGICTDLSSDSHNCGRCAHDCLYGVCLSGKCQAWPVVTNTTVAADVDCSLVADSTYVTWGENQYFGVKAYQAKVMGSPATMLPVTLDPTSPCLSLSNGVLAFFFGGSVYTMPEGQTVATVQSTYDTNTYGPWALAFDSTATNAILAGVNAELPYPDSLQTCSLDGGACSALSAGVTGGSPGTWPGQLFVNAMYAFWRRQGGSQSNTLFRYTFSTGAIDMVSTSVLGVVAIDQTNVYWVGSPDGGIYSLPQSMPSGVTPFTVSPAVSDKILGLASDGANVYFGTSSDMAASLYYVPVGSGKANIMYTSPHASGSAEHPVVTAGGAIIWVDQNLNADGGTQYSIMGIAAP